MPKRRRWLIGDVPPLYDGAFAGLLIRIKLALHPRFPDRGLDRHDNRPLQRTARRCYSLERLHRWRWAPLRGAQSSSATAQGLDHRTPLVERGRSRSESSQGIIKGQTCRSRSSMPKGSRATIADAAHAAFARPFSQQFTNHPPSPPSSLTNPQIAPCTVQPPTGNGETQ